MPNSHINHNIIGKNVAEARKAKNLNQIELSAALEVDCDVLLSRKIISVIESGKRPVKDIELHALSKVLEVSTDYFFKQN